MKKFLFAFLIIFLSVGKSWALVDPIDGGVELCRLHVCNDPNPAYIDGCAVSYTEGCMGSGSGWQLDSCTECLDGYNLVTGFEPCVGGGEIEVSYCEQVCTGCTNCTDVTWENFGTGYQRYIHKSCSCNTCNSSYSFRCSIGYYGTSLNGTTGCTACPYGSTNTAPGLTTVASCACVSNYYGDASTGSACLDCPPNSVCTVGNGSTFTCAIGYYKNQAGTACTQCPSGSTTGGTGATDISACKCSAGYYMNGSSCSQCPANSTTNSTGSLSISDCKCIAGYYGSSGSCTSCASGTGNPSATSTFGENTTIDKCYLLPDYSGNDGTGTYGYSSNCGYTGP